MSDAPIGDSAEPIDPLVKCSVCGRHPSDFFCRQHFVVEARDLREKLAARDAEIERLTKAANCGAEQCTRGLVKCDWHSYKQACANAAELQARAEAAERERDEARAEVERYRLGNDTLTAMVSAANDARDEARARVARLEEALREVMTVHMHQDHDCSCPKDFCESEHVDPDNCAACDPCDCCKSVDDIARAALEAR